MDKILSNIKYGWCDFNLGDYKGRPSYIRFLPFDILDAYEEYCKNQHCIIEFDEELTQFCIVIWEDNLVILDNRGGVNKCIFFDVSAKKVLNELLREIINDVPLWAEWVSTNGTEENIKHFENVIEVELIR